jgi:DNA-binding Xre family transcriptional regulator
METENIKTKEKVVRLKVADTIERLGLTPLEGKIKLMRAGLSWDTVDRLVCQDDHKVTVRTIKMACEAFDCPITDIIEIV